jgi:transposase
MAAIKYKVELTEVERSRLNEVSQRGKASVRTVKRALSLLKADQGLRDREIADVLLVNAATVARARKRYVEEGLEAAINDRPRPGQERKLDGKQEAHPVSSTGQALIAIACSAAPAGHTHWTLQLLADQVVELEFADSISLETVRQMLKKTNSSPGRRRSGVSPR